jgi:hypothetical protein
MHIRAHEAPLTAPELIALLAVTSPLWGPFALIALFMVLASLD